MSIDRSGLLRTLADAVIAEMRARDPDRVARVIPKTVERLTNEGRFSGAEIEAAIAEVCQEFGIDPKRGVN